MAKMRREGGGERERGREREFHLNDWCL